MNCKTSNMRLLAFVILVTLLCLGTAYASQSDSNFGRCNPKYIFFFIGDGMASVQIHATEAYLAALQEDDTVEGGIKADFLTMSHFPVHGMQTTFANNCLITDSAAAATALACGMKTNIGIISKSPDLTTNYCSIAEMAKKKGMKVGIVSSVSINHATPAAFYSHTDYRENFHDIAMQLANSDLDYFAGGYWSNSGEAEPNQAEDTAKDNGFKITHNLADLKAQKHGTRVIAFDSSQDEGGHTGALKYELDRSADSISLSQFTKQGIRLLKRNRKGFFMMIEGGKIDWACHANDARAVIEDIIAFDDAIRVAVRFAKRYPGETLIVVTGDHESGGMAIGNTSTGYDTHFEVLSAQTMTYERFDREVLPAYILTHYPAPLDIDVDLWTIILSNFGMDGIGLTAEIYDDLDEYQLKQLETAFDATVRSSGNSVEEDWAKYAYYTPLTITLTRTLNGAAGLSWASNFHTGVPVPVFAMGKRAKLFSGFYDNTDIPKRLAMAMGGQLDN